MAFGSAWLPPRNEVAPCLPALPAKADRFQQTIWQRWAKDRSVTAGQDLPPLASLRASKTGSVHTSRTANACFAFAAEQAGHF